MNELVEEIARLVRSAPDDINEVLGELTGTITICMISNVILPVFDQCLEDFARDNPRVKLNIAIYPWQEAVTHVLELQADVAVVYHQVPKAELHYHWLCRETQRLYCGPNHKLYNVKVSDPMTLSREPFVLTGRDEAEEVTNFRLRYGLGSKVRAMSEDLSEAKRLIHAGIGIGFLPAVNAVSTANQGDLWPLLDDSSVDLPSYDLWLVRPLAIPPLSACRRS